MEILNLISKFETAVFHKGCKHEELKLYKYNSKNWVATEKEINLYSAQIEEIRKQLYSILLPSVDNINIQLTKYEKEFIKKASDLEEAVINYGIDDAEFKKSYGCTKEESKERILTLYQKIY